MKKKKLFKLAAELRETMGEHVVLSWHSSNIKWVLLWETRRDISDEQIEKIRRFARRHDANFNIAALPYDRGMTVSFWWPTKQEQQKQAQRELGLNYR